MKKNIILLLTFLTLNLFAQSDQDTSFNKFHFSTNVGGIFNGEGISLDAAIGGGYRFTKRSAVGLDLRAFSASHNVRGLGVTGLNLFYEYNRGIYYKGGVGFPLRASNSDSECYNRYEYQPLSGYYVFNSIGYHTKKGFTIGLNLTVASNLKFDYFYHEDGCYDQSSPLILSNETNKAELLAFTLNLGYELPILKSNTPNKSYKTFFYDSNLSRRRFFGELSTGIFKLANQTSLDFELAGNYRLSKFLVTGLEGRYFYSDEISGSRDFFSRRYNITGIGAHVGYDNGLYAKYSYGLLTNDHLEILSQGTLINYKINGGHYRSFKLGYHFKKGLLVGVNLTSLSKMRLYYEDGSVGDDQLSLYGLLIGYSWPN